MSSTALKPWSVLERVAEPPKLSGALVRTNLRWYGNSGGTTIETKNGGGRQVRRFPQDPTGARRAPSRGTGRGGRGGGKGHTSRPWRIHELTRDFQLEDVWALPTPGGPHDFPLLVQGIAASDPAQGRSRAVRALFAIRWKVGELLGWDDPDTGIGSRVPTLRDRLPADLRDAPTGPDSDTLPFTSVYLLDDEWAAEIANRTMHGVLHVGWVPDGTGGYRGQMAVLVKRSGLFGTAYMAAIRPVRHLIVYPAMMRQIERDWRARAGEPTPAPAQPRA